MYIASDMAVAEEAASGSDQMPGIAEAEDVTAGQHDEAELGGNDSSTSAHVEQPSEQEGKHVLNVLFVASNISPAVVQLI